MLEVVICLSLPCVTIGFVIWFFYPSHIYNKKNVVGHKINFPYPYKNDLIIKNNFLPYKKKFIDEILRKVKNAKNDSNKSAMKAHTSIPQI